MGCSRDAANSTQSENESGLASPLPARHPADRDYTLPADPLEEGISRRVNEAPSTTSKSSTSLLGFLRNKHVQSLRFTAPILFSIHILLLGGTVVIWVYATKLAKAHQEPQDSALFTGAFLHVVFVMAIIIQLVLIKRLLFRLRARRYPHPDEVSSHRRSPSFRESIILSAPWNRPPLPTYAAAMALSGARTGDVEDNMIAMLPPPAYGNNRGSTLLLSSPSVQSPESSVEDRSRL